MHRVHLAEQLRLRHRPREALREIGRALAEEPRSVDALVELAWIHLALQQPGEAKAAALEALAVEPENPDALLFLFAPLGIAFYALVLWFLLYLMVHLVAPVFLGPVLFDKLGQRAARDLAATWWLRNGRRAFQLVLVGGSAMAASQVDLA